MGPAGRAGQQTPGQGTTHAQVGLTRASGRESGAGGSVGVAHGFRHQAMKPWSFRGFYPPGRLVYGVGSPFAERFPYSFLPCVGCA